MRAGSEPIAWRIAAAAAVALSLGVAAVASAQPSASAAATLQFDKGRALMKQKKYAEACTAFEQSQKLDPQLGTLYNLGLCYAELGKIASAWNALREVSQRDTNAVRKREANRHAKQLEPRLSKLLLTIASAPPGLAVKMNGVDVTAFLGAESPVDPAEYELEATAPGHAAWQTTAEIAEEGKTVTLAIELAPLPASEPPVRGSGPEPPRAVDRPRPLPPLRRSSWRKPAAAAAAYAGGTVLVTGLVFGGLANVQWGQATRLCPDGVCRDTTEFEAASGFADDANRNADRATVLVIGGAVLLGAGVVLWLTDPSRKPSPGTAVRIAPRLGPGHAAVTLEGRFP